MLIGRGACHEFPAMHSNTDPHTKKLCTAKNTKEGFRGRINHKHQSYTNCHFTHVHTHTHTHFQI